MTVMWQPCLKIVVFTAVFQMSSPSLISSLRPKHLKMENVMHSFDQS